MAHTDLSTVADCTAVTVITTGSRNSGVRLVPTAKPLTLAERIEAELDRIAWRVSGDAWYCQTQQTADGEWIAVGVVTRAADRELDDTCEHLLIYVASVVHALELGALEEIHDRLLEVAL
jgi:hypothetical protein